MYFLIRGRHQARFDRLIIINTLGRPTRLIPHEMIGEHFRISERCRSSAITFVLCSDTSILVAISNIGVVFVGDLVYKRSVRLLEPNCRSLVDYDRLSGHHGRDRDCPYLILAPIYFRVRQRSQRRMIVVESERIRRQILVVLSLRGGSQWSETADRGGRSTS